jgi:tRNA(Ile)-lysidine synthase
VFPLLEQHNPALKAVLCRSARVIADDYALLRAQLEAAWPQVVRGEDDRAVTFDLTAWRALPTALQRSSLREAIHRLRRSLRNINFVHVEDALRVARDGTTGMQATLPQGLMLSLGYDHLCVADAGHPIDLPDGPWLPADGQPLPVPLPGELVVNAAGWMIHLRVMDRSDLPPGWSENQEPWRATLDADVLGEDLILRTRQPGDRFQPLGMEGHEVKLGDFLTNQKVPQTLRSRIPLLEAAWGIAWVGGLRVDERARIADSTTRVVQAEFTSPAHSPT